MGTTYVLTSGAFDTAASWNPARDTPAVTDVLDFSQAAGEALSAGPAAPQTVATLIFGDAVGEMALTGLTVTGNVTGAGTVDIAPDLNGVTIGGTCTLSGYMSILSCTITGLTTVTNTLVGGSFDVGAGTVCNGGLVVNGTKEVIVSGTVVGSMVVNNTLATGVRATGTFTNLTSLSGTGVLAEGTFPAGCAVSVATILGGTFSGPVTGSTIKAGTFSGVCTNVTASGGTFTGRLDYRASKTASSADAALDLSGATVIVHPGVTLTLNAAAAFALTPPAAGKLILAPGARVIVQVAGAAVATLDGTNVAPPPL